MVRVNISGVEYKKRYTRSFFLFFFFFFFSALWRVLYDRLLIETFFFFSFSPSSVLDVLLSRENVYMAVSLHRCVGWGSRDRRSNLLFVVEAENKMAQYYWLCIRRRVSEWIISMNYPFFFFKCQLRPPVLVPAFHTFLFSFSFFFSIVTFLNKLELRLIEINMYVHNFFLFRYVDDFSNYWFAYWLLYILALEYRVAVCELWFPRGKKFVLRNSERKS